MITITQVLTLAASAVEGSSNITSFITANYPSATLKTFVGENGSNPPTENDAPFVSFLPSLRPYDMGSGTEYRQPVFEIEFGLLDRGETVEGSRTTYNGLTNIDTFGQLILAAVNSAFGLEYVKNVDYTLDDSLRYPLIQGAMTVNLWFPQGAGEFSLN